MILQAKASDTGQLYFWEAETFGTAGYPGTGTPLEISASKGTGTGGDGSGSGGSWASLVNGPAYPSSSPATAALVDIGKLADFQDTETNGEWTIPDDVEWPLGAMLFARFEAGGKVIQGGATSIMSVPSDPLIYDGIDTFYRAIPVQGSIALRHNGSNEWQLFRLHPTRPKRATFELTGPTDYYDDHVIAQEIDLSEYPWATEIEYMLIGGGQGGQSGGVAVGGYGGGSGGRIYGRCKINTPGEGVLNVYVGRGGPGGVFVGPTDPALGGIGGNTAIYGPTEISPVAWVGGLDPLGGGELPGAGWAPGGAPGIALPPDVMSPFAKLMTHIGQQESSIFSDVGVGAGGTSADGGGGARGWLGNTPVATAGVTATGAGGGGGLGYGAGGGGGGQHATTPGAGGAGADGYARVILHETPADT